jgi:hypothetical protein
MQIDVTTPGPSNDSWAERIQRDLDVPLAESTEMALLIVEASLTNPGAVVAVLFCKVERELAKETLVDLVSILDRNDELDTHKDTTLYLKNGSQITFQVEKQDAVALSR